MKCASEINWIEGNRYKTLIIITDAPCHGSSYHGNVMDDFSDMDKEFDNLEECIRKLVVSNTTIIGLELPNLEGKILTNQMYTLIEKQVKMYKGHFVLL